VNDSDLNALLARARVPERTTAQWNDFATDTMRQLAASQRGGARHSDAARNATGSQATSSRLRFVTELFSRAQWWAAGLAAVCLVAGALVGAWLARRPSARDEFAEARKLFSELNALFPNQVQAVVLEGSSPRLVLAERPLPNRGAPLFVRICGASGCQRVITFSGERVSVNGEACDVLVDAAGHVIISGERFVWTSSDASARAGNYRIDAAALAGLL